MKKPKLIKIKIDWVNEVDNKPTAIVNFSDNSKIHRTRSNKYSLVDFSPANGIILLKVL